MSYETRAYDNEHGDPVVVLVATGTHDVSRLVNLLNGAGPNSEQCGLGRTVLRQVRRHNAGRAALRLLRDHGGPDFTTPVDDHELLTAVLDVLEHAGCQFWACEGPTLEPIDMVTCNACATVARLRQRLGKPIRQGVEGSFPLGEMTRDEYLRQAVSGR